LVFWDVIVSWDLCRNFLSFTCNALEFPLLAVVNNFLSWNALDFPLLAYFICRAEFVRGKVGGQKRLIKNMLDETPYRRKQNTFLLFI
jgi:hypothetical protein